jgi:hypothetical protein
MYKSVKISADAYKTAKSLTKELEKSGKFPGLEKVNLSTAMGYALTTALEDVKSKRMLHESAGVWKDVDTDKMIREIYESRRKSSKKPVKL